MDRNPTHRLNHEAGFATIQHLATVGIALVFFVMLANLVVMQYTMGAVTGALDEGVRFGARTIADPIGSCEERIFESIGSILAGPVAETVVAHCFVDGEFIRAEATGRLSGWLPAVPDVTFRRTAVSPREPFEFP